MSTATARAHPNIALVKYWGKAEEDLILPVAGSMSMTLDAFATTTTVTVRESEEATDAEDSFVLNGTPATGTALDRTTRFLDHVRELAGSSARADVVSVNEAPTAAGLASSASGFAALALAASRAYGLDLDQRSLSRLARRGSGSACRSVVDRYAVWNAGTDDATSYAEPIDAPEMRLVIVTVDGAQKQVSSREGMRRTAATSPFYDAWITSTARTLEDMVAACKAGDLTAIGEITESHALRMHAVIASALPPVRYLAPASVAAFDTAAALREQGTFAYATADAGPNVCVLTTPDAAEDVAAALTPHGQVRIVGPGPGAHLTEEAAR
ncbi:diphosphomevalonate decarboxylase [Brachybacterium endophyticum]|uniref:diphosphomevalonate decarboxylase n=1 Tax=Brachybacterium endophyticum TaxID=2182385 RepID=A0A2U2RHH8_9MICO|nr:diphosphomevalonate decarboxylase [Brachybacterium endophyticum]PWH05281.1 diphosphomevalonate decarboxylase [Brachybacterium endophyticum]